MGDLLGSISSPADLRRLPRRRLPAVCDELRGYILDTISKVGGHLSSNLGTVELTVALHYVFDTPRDLLVWDVGHQTYGHKVLTGRRELLPTIRRRGGLSGFPRRSESEHDTFGTAHSSTAISAALGMAVASSLRGEKRKVVAVVGDGAMSGGMAFEALNNVSARPGTDLLVVLNDNEMSISHPVGALRNHLSQVIASRLYGEVRRQGARMLEGVPPVQRFVERAHEHLKGMVFPGTFFEELGLDYIGPVDGHDVGALVRTLRELRKRPGPRLLHVVTQKGKGFGLAETNPVLYHGVGKFEPEKGIVKGGKPSPPTHSKVFGEWLLAAAAADDRLVAITPAMCEGSGMAGYARRFPDRYFDVGIAEQHAVTFAGGLCCQGMRPVVAIYSTFLQRGYDQLIHDIAIQDLPVTFAIDRAGLVGADGATHHGAFDLSYLRCVPNMAVMAPSDEDEMWRMLNTAHLHDGPATVRYPRGAGTGREIDRSTDSTVEIGKGVVRSRGRGVAFLCFGQVLHDALEVARGLGASVADMRFAKPIDAGLVREMAEGHDSIVTVEDNVVSGGAGSAVLEALAEAGISRPVLQIGLPDRFVDHGTPEELRAECGLDSEGISRRVEGWLKGGGKPPG